MGRATRLGSTMPAKGGKAVSKSEFRWDQSRRSHSTLECPSPEREIDRLFKRSATGALATCAKHLRGFRREPGARNGPFGSWKQIKYPCEHIAAHGSVLH